MVDSPEPLKVTGVCPVLETPFTRNQEIDPDSFSQLAKAVYGAGTRVVMFPGFASEFFKLDPGEKSVLVDVLVEVKANHPDLALVLSIAQHATTKAVDEVHALVERGADAINLLPSYFSDPHPLHRRNHIEAVLDAAGTTPVILQYAPNQTGSTMSISDFSLLAQKYTNFRQVKVESTPPGPLITQLATSEPSIASIVGYAGVQMIDAMERGAASVQPGCSFVEVYQEIWRLWNSKQYSAARELHTRLLPFISYWMQGVELIVQAEKTISMRRGLIETDTCRSPGRPLDDSEQKTIDMFFQEFESFF